MLGRMLKMAWNDNDSKIGLAVTGKYGKYYVKENIGNDGNGEGWERHTAKSIHRGCGRFLGPELSNSKTASILHRTQTP